MADQTPSRIVLIKDGDNFYMRHLATQAPVHVAYIDTAQNNAEGKGTIRALIPGGGTETEVDHLLDLAKLDIENYMGSGQFDRDRGIVSAQDATSQAAA